MIVILGLLVVVALTAVLFAAYLVAIAYGAVARLFNGSAASAARPASTDVGPRCLNAGCRSANPAHARFCRRCGAAMARTGVYMRYPTPTGDRLAV